MSDNEQIIRDFIQAWSRLDAGELAAFFTEDGVYHNMPTTPVVGRAAVRGFIGSFLKSWTATEWEIVSLVSAGDIVVAERVDRTRMGDKTVDLPCCGVFEMQGGKIRVWRDYFDMGAYARAMAG